MDKLDPVNKLIGRNVYKRLNIDQNRCLLCLSLSSSDLSLCDNCTRDLPYVTSKCKICSKPLKSSGICGDCLSSAPNKIYRAQAAFVYDYPVDQLLLDFKFHNNLLAGQVLARLMTEKLSLSLHRDDKPDAIIAVPLHARRLRERGFNQALELAKTIGQRLRIPVLIDHVRRIKNTAHQTNLNAKQRRTNIHNAFQVNRAINGKDIVIVDDVITTGSTTKELADSLLRAGASKAQVWTCAIRP